MEDDRAAPAQKNLFVFIGTAWVIVGGLVAAMTGPLSLEHGSWAAAYQVLVAGVGQVALGVAQSVVAPARPSRRVLTAQLLTWNLGSVAVLGGTLTHTPLVVDAGGVLLLVALALMIRTIRGGTGPTWARWTYRIIVAIIVVSIPIGLILAHLRAS
ncbi:hypothetical protein DC31_06080 [Microbacterium sp. CH12i]|uniref:hypothetical protein n=1 Tax=Microbacterium sp. CH12i TaxID=1479651 RepID=UPI000461B696|nr:hypothetical protein [Microbacterium sp. CH12i]KDA04551.1 hypothetical protein DC31_06080 [Microbacterium sp. CH12i]